MATTITLIKRAVIMLDQSSGELREEDGELLGLDLWPETQAAFSDAGARGLEAILAVPTDLNTEAVTGLSGWIDGLTVAAISPDLVFSMSGDTFSSLSEAEPGTALVSADRRLRGEAAKAGLQPAPHAGLLPMMMRGEAPEAVRMVGPREVLTHLGLSDNVIPMQFQPANGKAWALIALVTGDIQTSAVIKGVKMNPLPYDPMTEDLVWARIFRIRTEILERYRKILRANPLPGSLKPFEREMRELIGSEWFQDEDFRQMTDAELRYRIEQIFRLRPWYPWWKKLCTIAGFGADLVIVGCHLDSTAGFEPGYVASTDPAPGRDDNASGLAGVLSMARYMWSLRGKFTHTVRFCFFNAEESGLIGSKAYAAKLKSLEAPIRAVICMDMIGHNSDPNRLFEIHAGYTDPAIRDLSLPLTTYVENAAAAYGQLAPAQVYAGTSLSGAPDRSVYDNAINRSDHAAFHQQGYPAILVSEDLFANLASEPGADPNPNYHKATDTFVDLAYARDIVCAVSQAVINLAR